MIVEQAYWDESYAQHAFVRVSAADPTRQYIHRRIPRATPGQTAFEIGCFPGRYLREIGALGYEVHGCDTTPRVERELGAWLAAEQLRVGTITRGDVRTMAPERHDVVASFGFVEHFPDYLDLFRRHFDFVKPGGLVLVTFPNLAGAVQQVLHRALDRENLDRHVLEAMRVDIYRREAECLGTVLYAGYYGAFEFWTDDRRKRNGVVRRLAVQGIHHTRWLWPLLPDSSRWSPYGAILVRAAQ